MLLFPGDIKSLLAHLADRLELDADLVNACRPSFESETHQELITTASTVLVQRLGQKSGLASEQLDNSEWSEKIDWETAGFSAEQRRALIAFCEGVLANATFLPATAKTSRALLLLIDALLVELEALPDLAQPDEAPESIDARPFFDELVKSLNALLPYAQRDFPTLMISTQVKLLLSNLPNDAYYAVEIFPPAGDDPGHLEMGIHFESGDIEKLSSHFKRKIPGLSHSLGGKEIILQERDSHLAILLQQQYQPTEKLSAFMTAATLVGLIGSIQERMPRR